MRLVGAGREHQVGVLTFITSAIPVIFGIKMLDRNDEMRPNMISFPNRYPTVSFLPSIRKKEECDNIGGKCWLCQAFIAKEWW